MILSKYKLSIYMVIFFGCSGKRNEVKSNLEELTKSSYQKLLDSLPEDVLFSNDFDLLKMKSTGELTKIDALKRDCFLIAFGDQFFMDSIYTMRYRKVAKKIYNYSNKDFRIYYILSKDELWENMHWYKKISLKDTVSYFYAFTVPDGNTIAKDESLTYMTFSIRKQKYIVHQRWLIKNVDKFEFAKMLESNTKLNYEILESDTSLNAKVENFNLLKNVYIE